MSGQDDKFAILDRANSFYNIFRVILEGYDLESVLPAALMTAYINYENGSRSIQGSDALIDAVKGKWREIKPNEFGTNNLGILANELITMPDSGLYLLEEKLLDLDKRNTTKPTAMRDISAEEK